MADAIETIDDFSGEFTKNEKFCENCKHLHSNGYTCDAFPEGIPTKYLTGAKEHTSSRWEDIDIVWELDEKQKFDTRLQKMLEKSEHVVIRCGEDGDKAEREEEKLEKLGFSTWIHTRDTMPITYTVHGVK